MLGVIGIWIYSKASFEDNRRCIYIYISLLFILDLRSGTGKLCANISNQGIQSGMDIFDIIFTHHFLVNEGRVFLLLGEE